MNRNHVTEGVVSTACKAQPVAFETMCVDQSVLTVRSIELTDVERLARMFGRLSRESVRLRFFSPIPRLSWPTLLRLADVDHLRREALVALVGDEIVAVARYSALEDASRSGTREAEIAVTVEDAWQHRGVGRRLTRRLSVLALDRGYETFVARVLPENRAALRLIRDLAPDASVNFDGGDYEAHLPLAAANASFNALSLRPRRTGRPRVRPDDR
jgi:RimJ/RimL family protein N-acetyltransferase